MVTCNMMMVRVRFFIFVENFLVCGSKWYQFFCSPSLHLIGNQETLFLFLDFPTN